MPNWLRKLLGIERHVVAEIVKDFESVNGRLVAATRHHLASAHAAHRDAAKLIATADRHQAEAGRAQVIAGNIAKLIAS